MQIIPELRLHTCISCNEKLVFKSFFKSITKIRLNAALISDGRYHGKVKGKICLQKGGEAFKSGGN